LRVEVQALLDAGDFSGALALCQERSQEAPDDADAHRHLAQLQAAQGLFDLALLSARRAYELTPGDPRVWSDLGLVQARAIGEFYFHRPRTRGHTGCGHLNEPSLTARFAP
jgi:Flp pilus assembly protein TadD